MKRASSFEQPVGLPLRVSLLTSLPIAMCMGVMALPELGHAYAGVYRAFYATCYLFWIVPLSLIQRAMWQRGVPARISIPVLLLATYIPSVINNALAQAAALHWGLVPSYEFRRIFAGLDGCWLALIAFCAIHELLHHYDALQRSRRREVEAKMLAREAELRALQYQLHPHFLFNTLNAISTLVVEERTLDATRMIARLGDFLRATLEGSGAHIVTLAEELALTESYLDIEKARLGNRLDVVLQIGSAVLQATVPYLILQPLVENAIRHGIAPRRQGGRLEISATRLGQRLQLSLRNDGVASIEKPSRDGRTESSAVGLHNVRERLLRLYEDNHRLTVDISSNGSCHVMLELPFRTFRTFSANAGAAVPA